jgi:predicted nuclease of restriction endonuclease-like (RecB) superfamily
MTQTDEPPNSILGKAHDYLGLFTEIKKRIYSAQYEALKAVNRELVGLYWDIGRLIVERQNSEGWGKSVVEKLSADLRREFPDVGGFSVQNLWYMRQFYSEYHDNERLQPMVGEIAWAHNLVIMSKCKDPLEREFYIRMTRKFGWSKNVLLHQIENQSYEKSLLGQTNFDRTLTPDLVSQAKLAVKDEYTFGFLELGEAHSERELERALIARIEDFLRAMGGNHQDLAQGAERPTALATGHRSVAGGSMTAIDEDAREKHVKGPSL